MVLRVESRYLAFQQDSSMSLSHLLPSSTSWTLIMCDQSHKKEYLQPVFEFCYCYPFLFIHIIFLCLSQLCSECSCS
eukprot:m.195460 g.195460  ORF g.195460 m.195460 type:complete len:77 (-) comp13667_c2_seq2:188-418(-)